MKSLSIGSNHDVATAAEALPSWLLWAGATTLGYAVGMALGSDLVGSVLRPLGPALFGMLNVFIYGAVIGAALGAAQFAVMPRDWAPWRWWLAASVLGNAASYAIATVTSEAISNAQDPGKNTVLGFGVTGLVAGAFIGLVSSLAQWVVLRRCAPGLRAWILASTIGMALGSVAATALLGLFDIPLFEAAPSLWVGAILGVFIGASQGLVLRFGRRVIENDGHGV